MIPQDRDWETDTKDAVSVMVTPRNPEAVVN